MRTKHVVVLPYDENWKQDFIYRNIIYMCVRRILWN